MLLYGLLVLVLSGVVFVNGWTDAPNAIAGAVATKALTYRKAVGLAATFNLLGLMVMTVINPSVAGTVTSMVSFDALAPREALVSLLSAMLAVVVFAVAAWFFGIPTSESHALIAALSGAAAAAGSLDAINRDAWGKVVAGLAISLVIGFFSGLLVTALCVKRLRTFSEKRLDTLQTLSACAMAFMHGAQDGQKFMAVFIIADMLAKGRYASGFVDIRGHMLVLVFCAAVMALGTSFGGRRIIDTVGTKMVRLEKPESVCADAAGGICLLFASFSGIPMSTTHTKTTAVMGAGIRGAGRKNPANVGIIGGMLLAWGITFPVCGALGWLFAGLAVAIC